MAWTTLKSDGSQTPSQNISVVSTTPESKNTTTIMDRLVIQDVVTARIKKILKQKKITDIDKFTKEQLPSWFYNEDDFHKRIKHSDGTWTPVPRNNFQLFLDHKLVLKKEQLKQLEQLLGYKKNEILTYLGMDTKAFLIGLGYLYENGSRNQKYFDSPRVQNYRVAKMQEKKAQQEAAKQVAKQREQIAREKKKSYLKRITDLATGIWKEKA